jgi:predicted nuclease of predicted toxin-antitoxin system
MTFWIDAQLPPVLARYLAEAFSVKASAIRDLGLRDSTDRAIFDAARDSGANLITKDSDFVELVQRLGPPPQIVWVTCGNSSNAHIRAVFGATFADTLKLLAAGDALVEIGDARSSR